MAFTNDTAYDVITRGNPNRVDMLLVMVEPPPEAGGDQATDLAWVETPVPIISANLIPNEAELLVRVVHRQSTVEGCARRGNQSLEIAGTDIVLLVTLMQPPDTPWAIPCEEETVEVDEVLPLGAALAEGKNYRIVANGQVTATLALPDPALGHTHIAESLVREFGIEESRRRAGPLPGARSVGQTQWKLHQGERLRDRAPRPLRPST